MQAEDDEKLRALLKNLIQGSASFSRSEKGQLLSKLSQLGGKELNMAIEVFENEKRAWLQLKKTSDEVLKNSQAFNMEQTQGIKAMATKLVREKEGSEMQQESQAAEILLSNL